MRELPSMHDDSFEGELQGGVLCPECQTGAMQLQYITYFTWLNQELVTVPNFPAWICDVCGRRDYDTRAIIWLNALLNPDAGRKPPARKPPQTASPRP